MPKIAFIEAGGFVFTRNLVRDLLSYPALSTADLYLMDVDAERLTYIRQAVDHIIEGGGYAAKVIATEDRWEALVYGLSKEEKCAMFEIVVKAVDNRLPVYGGIGGITTRESIELASIAQECGVNVGTVLTPMFIRPSQEELYEHFKRVALSTNLPLVIYNNSSRTGVNLGSGTVRRLAEIDTIVGIKDSSGDFTLLSEYIRLTKDMDFHVLAGKDTLIYACLCCGGAGAVAACANIVPRIVVQIYDRFVCGDLQGALEFQRRLAPLRLAFELGTFPAVLKEALKLIGIDAGSCLDPVGSLSLHDREMLKSILDEINTS
jgi:4-hydroxy-tetrahydrodipicolinate synthase